MKINRHPFWFIVALFAVLCGSAIAAQFTLEWTDNSTNEKQWVIERSSDGSTFFTLKVLDSTTENAINGKPTYIDAGLPNSTQYWYRLKARNAAGDSGYSNVATGTTPPNPALPATPGTLSLSWPGSLVNLSTRGVVVVTSEPLIGGFVIQGGPAKVLLRGIGPGLARFGVPDTMADPQITLLNSAGTSIGNNDNWSGSAISDAAAMVGAFSLPAGSKDAAILITLDPGAYTIHLTGTSGSVGAALVEIYLVP